MPHPAITGDYAEPPRRYRAVGPTRTYCRPRRYIVDCDWSGLPAELGPQQIVPGSEETQALYAARVAAGFMPTHPGDTFVERGVLAMVAEAVTDFDEFDE